MRKCPLTLGALELLAAPGCGHWPGTADSSSFLVGPLGLSTAETLH